MKRSLWLPLFLALGAGCSTEVPLIAPGDPVPVVYCLLDPTQAVQYVRVGQTYSVYPGDTSFVPDQEEILIREEILVYLAAEHQQGEQEFFYGSLIDSIPKDSGFFPSGINQIYAIPCVIQPGTRYSLYIHFTGSNRIIHGETAAMYNMILFDPAIVPGREATLVPGIDFYVRFAPNPGGPVFQSTMTLRYAEWLQGQWIDRTLELPQKFVFVRDEETDYGEQRISGERFLIDISRALKPEAGIRRVPLALDFHVSCGGEDLALKIEAENNTQSFSILDVNSFDNAYGVFSCLTHRFVRDVPLSTYTLDTLAMGPLTRHLGFLTSQQIDSLYYGKN